jgi:outer membrane protein OmpA-like peptidoglycan-associated protein
VENLVLAKVVGLLRKENFYFLPLFLISCFFLSSCASSTVSRDAASNVDMGVQNAKSLVDSDGSIVDSYQNASQKAKGFMLGGAAGAGVGALSSGIGIIPGAAVGALFGGTYGSYIDSYTSYSDQLENRGATMVVLGDQILIILPSASIFHAMTANIKPDAYSTLKLVAKYINGYTKMLVKIAAYTNAVGPKEVDLALSQQQAESVAKFLWACGLDARLTYAVGYGGTHLVQKNFSSWDESDNYRIEITLEKLYV